MIRTSRRLDASILSAIARDALALVRSSRFASPTSSRARQRPHARPRRRRQRRPPRPRVSRHHARDLDRDSSAARARFAILLARVLVPRRLAASRHIARARRSLIVDAPRPTMSSATNHRAASSASSARTAIHPSSSSSSSSSSIRREVSIRLAVSYTTHNTDGAARPTRARAARPPSFPSARVTTQPLPNAPTERTRCKFSSRHVRDRATRRDATRPRADEGWRRSID